MNMFFNKGSIKLPLFFSGESPHPSIYYISGEAGNEVWRSGLELFV